MVGSLPGRGTSHVALVRRRRQAWITFGGLIVFLAGTSWWNSASIVHRRKYGGLLGEDAKYLYFFEQVDCNGLNNQRVGLRTGLAMAELLGRVLILPQFHNRHRIDSPVLPSYFFDPLAFETHFYSALPNLYLTKLFPHWESLPVNYIDIGTVPEPPSDAPWLPRLRTHKAAGFHLGATEEEMLHWFGHLDDRLLVFYSAFRRFGQFASAERQDSFDRRVFLGIVPQRWTAGHRDDIVRHLQLISPGRRYNCLHLRRGDTFLEEHQVHEKSLSDIAKLSRQYLDGGTPLYISTDTPNDEIRQLFLGRGYVKVHFLVDHFPVRAMSHVTTPDGNLTMRWGQIDQAVCANAELFVGNIWSTFTHHIGFIRRMSGTSQVCQDIYGREMPENMAFI